MKSRIGKTKWCQTFIFLTIPAESVFSCHTLFLLADDVANGVSPHITPAEDNSCFFLNIPPLTYLSCPYPKLKMKLELNFAPKILSTHILFHSNIMLAVPSNELFKPFIFSKYSEIIQMAVFSLYKSSAPLLSWHCLQCSKKFIFVEKL